ncbi:MAG: hypothetical protein D6693_11150 [Planctomycetota bacterium]|nr:MAG: hypothetical protein D6693_11150 [Planctomycetota bacterium]
MASAPVNIARVPNLLASQVMLANISRTGADLVRLQTQLSSGLRVESPSDDPIGASLIGALEQRLGRADQRLRNLQHASSALGVLDQALGEITDLSLEAREIAAGQVGAASDTDTRAAQAEVVQSLIDRLVRAANTEFDGLRLLGGDRTGVDPIQSFNGAYRYVGAGAGLGTDITPGVTAPITLSADTAIGALSARVAGDVDLDPTILTTTRLTDLAGNLQRGVALGAVEIDITNGPTQTITVDLSTAESVGDAMNLIESAIRQADPGALAGAYPTGVGVAVSGDRLALSVAPGVSIDIRDIGAGTTAADLGLSGFTYTSATPDNPAVDLDPRLTDETTFAQLAPATPIDFGDVVFRNGGRVGSVTVTPAMTIADFRSAVERLGLGVRIEITPDGRGLAARNEVSGSRLSIEEAGAGTFTATTLGLRSFKPTTPISVFNDGRGVEIADGAIDPITGLPDPNRNVDLRITLTDGSSFQVDFTPADMIDVQSVLGRINADAAAAGLGGVFTATLSDAGNGIVLEDTAGGGGAIAVAQLNGRAGEDLGLLDGSFTPGAPARFAGTDRATVRVDGLLTALIELRDALLADDSAGITLAGEAIERSADRAAQARAVVGARAKRVEDASAREEESMTLDRIVKSRIQDLDFVEASSRFSLLQLAMQAGLTATAQTQSLTLLNFLR